MKCDSPNVGDGNTEQINATDRVVLNNTRFFYNPIVPSTLFRRSSNPIASTKGVMIMNMYKNLGPIRYDFNVVLSE